MSVRAPRRSNADGLQENMLKAILEPTASDSEPTESNGIEERGVQRGDRSSFLDTTSLSTCSKRSLHSSRLTLSDTKEFYKTIGIRWINAVRIGDAVKVKKMLEEKPELVHYAPMYGPMALHIATSRADKTILMLLAAKGADMDARDAAGYTSLQLAIRRGNSSLGHFLISQGANIELCDPDGLHISDYVAWSDKDQLSAELVAHGKPILRPKSHSFVGSPSSISVKSNSSSRRRPLRPSSTPDSSICSENEKPMKRDRNRSSWKSFFENNPITRKFSTNSKL